MAVRSHCVERLCLQAGAVNAEVILADGSAGGVPEEFIHRSKNLHWLKLPGASVFDLRARAIAAAQGDIIALTEDHCLVQSDWCARMIDAHDRHPDALAIAGAVENSSTVSIMDRANFFLTFAPFLPPLAADHIRRAPTASNVSFKRSAIPDEALQPGWIELVINPALRLKDAVVFEDKIRVTHVQSHGFWGTFKAHFHNGRTSTGLIVQRFTPKQRRESLARCILIPIILLHESIRSSGARRLPARQIMECVPALALLALCHTAGHAIGLVKGPGQSPLRLV